MTPGHLKHVTRSGGDVLPQTNVNVSTCTGDCREGDGCIARANRNFKQKILFEVVTFTWITMHLDSLDCDADQEQRRGAYCSVLSRVTSHVTNLGSLLFLIRTLPRFTASPPATSPPGHSAPGHQRYIQLVAVLASF